jgi:VanZ family protein
LYARVVQRPSVLAPTAVSRRDWQRRASPLARYALFAYALIVVDASLYPFAGWRDLGLGPFDYLAADWPPRALQFDLLVNALGYAPLGFFAVLALHPRVRGAVAAGAAAALAALLSANLEALQTYLPARVASKVDLLANVAGALVGALVANRVAQALLDTGRLRVWRARWFAADASRGLVLSIVWFGALVYPDVFVFGTGGLLKVLDVESADRLGEWLGLVNGYDADLTAARFRIAETCVSALALTGAGLLFGNLVRDGARWSIRVALVAGFVAASVLVETVAHAFLFDPTTWPPLTPGSRSAVVFAFVALLVAVALPRRVRWALSLACLVGTVVLINVYPENPYVTAVGLSWTRGRLMNFYGLASGLNLVWPWFAIAYLLRHRGTKDVTRGRRGEPERRRAATSRSL